MSSWAPFGPSSDDDGEDKKDQPLWSGEDPAPPREEPESAQAEPEPPEPEPPAPEKPAYEPPSPPPFPGQPGMTPGDPLVGRQTPPPRSDLEWPPPAPDAPPPPPSPERPPLGTPTNATLSLVFGVLGLLVCPVILSVAAIGTGTSAKRQIDANPRYSGRGIAQAGIVLGAIGIAIWVIFFVLALIGYLVG